MTSSFLLTRSSLLLIGAFCALTLAACSQGDGGDTSVKEKKSLPEPNSAGAQLLDKYCNECHLAPHPSAHAKGEWKSVVIRMSDHRTTHGYHTLSDDELVTLTEYLEKYASGTN